METGIRLANILEKYRVKLAINKTDVIPVGRSMTERE